MKYAFFLGCNIPARVQQYETAARAVLRQFDVQTEVNRLLAQRGLKYSGKPHVKLRPVDFATDGVFVCGLAHAPKTIDESITQAQAAVARAVTVLAKKEIKLGGIISHIAEELCSGCLGCVNVCPFNAIDFDAEKFVAEVNPALCKGCGACSAACPSEAPALMGFDNNQLYAQIKSALSD